MNTRLEKDLPICKNVLKGHDEFLSYSKKKMKFLEFLNLFVVSYYQQVMSYLGLEDWD